MRRKTARDVMHAEVLAVREEMTVRELVGFLAENQISGAPVLDAKGHLAGVVSVTDIAQSGAPASAEEIRRLRVEDEALRVRDVMTPTVYTVPEDTPAARIAKAMIAGRFHRVFVTHGKRVVGIVTSLDLLKLLAENE